MNNLCTLYSSERIEERLSELIREKFSNPDIKTNKSSNRQIFNFSKKKGLFKGKTNFQISTRFRDSIALELDQSDLAKNLQGIKGFISQIPSAPPIGIKNLNTIIESVISETAILCSENDSVELFELVKILSKEKECILFCQSDSFVGKGSFPHFLSKELQLLLDVNGNSEIYPPTGPLVDMEEQEETKIFPDQIERKRKNIEFITNLGVPTIDHLPFVESENEVELRNSKEIASRAVILAIINLVAFSNISEQGAKGIISKYSLDQYVTLDELDFLNNPTDELKNQMSWKCEAIWTLCWALGIVENLGQANVLADLDQIGSEKYPISQGVDPNDFIKKEHLIRSKKEILDQNDLYYRLNWACVNERLKGNELTDVHPGVVYERQYALNWLVNYMDQEWDEVTCDT